MSEKKAKEILRDLPERKVLGHRMLKNVGKRAWERPNVAISAKLYNLYAIPDPFSPNEETKKWFIGLGPVSLKLGENRRQPAPHLMPKEPPPPKPVAAVQTPNIPKAQTRIAESKPDPQQEEAVQQAIQKQQEQGVQRAPAPKPSSNLAAEFGASPSGHKVARLPVRPDLQNKLGNDAPSAAPKRPEVPIQRSIPRPQQNSNQSSNGRIRMQRTDTTSTFKKVALPQPEPTAEASTTEAPIQGISIPKVEPKKEVARTAAPKAPTSLGLDDLFGVPAGDAKPMRLRPKKKDS